MEIVKKTVTVRGVQLEIETPGPDASPKELLSFVVEALTLACISSANEEGLEILRAYGLPVDDISSIFSSES